MNNHQNAIFHQITNFLKTPLALLGVDLKNFQFNKICHFANHPYLCKGLSECVALLWGGVSIISGSFKGFILFFIQLNSIYKSCYDEYLNLEQGSQYRYLVGLLIAKFVV